MDLKARRTRRDDIVQLCAAKGGPVMYASYRSKLLHIPLGISVIAS